MIDVITFVKIIDVILCARGITMKTDEDMKYMFDPLL
jgi:hypothetical protein